MITYDQCKNIHLFYGNILTPDEITEEVEFINNRVTNPKNWGDEVKTAAEICHHYALERAMLNYEPD